MTDLGNLIPESVENSVKKVLHFRDGLEYSFVNYVQSLGKFILKKFPFNSRLY